MLDFLRPKIIPFLIGVLFVNVAFLDYHLLFRANRPIVQNINLSDNSTGSNSNQAGSTEPNQAVQTEPAQVANQTNTCAPSCLDAIKQATASLNLNPTVIITQTPTQTTTTTVTQSSGPQEFFIPMGSGSLASQGTYASVPGIAAYVDTTKYSNISTVTFEVSAQIPNGNQTIYLQLINTTTGVVVANSQVTMSGGTPQLLISSPITLTSGNNLYQVQVNTQLNSAITIDQARIHITTN